MMKLLFSYFIDTVLQAPTIGAMLMCGIAAVIGSFVVLRGKSLISETLSHAAYPGVVVALFLERLFFVESDHEFYVFIYVLAGATCSCLLATSIIRFLEERFRVTSDSALAFVLASFFGIGMLLLSALQQDYPTLYKELQAYLFGQVATMRTIHLYVYAGLAILLLLVILPLFRLLQTVLFDPLFADVSGMPRKRVERLLFAMLVFSVVIGIRCAGVVLLSGMLIFPAAVARQYTNKLSTLLILCLLFGLICGFFGVLLSHELSLYFWRDQGSIFSLPTGPMIIIVASVLFFFSLLFSLRGGLLIRAYRKWRFLIKCGQENFLKAMWKYSVEQNKKNITYIELLGLWHKNSFSLHYMLFCLERRGWIQKQKDEGYQLTSLGLLWAKKIVRFHRLWELYLVECCKVAKERVHVSAEEMEHIITPEIEAELTYRLNDPQNDPHHSPIPKMGEIR